MPNGQLHRIARVSVERQQTGEMLELPEVGWPAGERAAGAPV